MIENVAINWDDPEERARLVEKIGPKAYNEAFAKYVQQSTVATVAGHSIRSVNSRFGKLWQVGNTGRSFKRNFQK